MIRIAYTKNTCCFISFCHPSHEELLYGNGFLKLRIVANIRIAETSQPQHTLYSEFSTLQGGVWS